MGTKIQANPYFRQYQSLINLDATTSNAMNEKWMLENGKNSDTLSSHDMEKMRHTILEHESTFRNQLRELHRLHGRQQELMNEIRRRGVNKDDARRPWTSCLPSSTHSMAGFLPSSGTYNLFSKKVQEGFSKFPIVESTSERRNLQTAFDGDTKLSLCAVQTSQPAAFIRDNSLVTKDFFHDSLDRMSKEGPRKSGIEHLSDDYYAEEKRNGKHSSVGGLFSGKALAFPQETRKEFSNCPSDIGTSLCRKKKKIFGVEIIEVTDELKPLDLVSNMSSNLDRGAHPVPTFESSSLGADAYAKKLKLHAAEWNDERNERANADSRDEMLPNHSGRKEKWLEGDFMTYFENVDNANKAAADVLQNGPEQSQKSREMIHQHTGSLPWFLRNSRASGDLNNGGKSCYFMNLDSLQNCSQKFFAKQKKEAEVQINEDNNAVDGNGSRNHLETAADKGMNNCISDSRHCIDLNMSLEEEDAPPADLESRKPEMPSGNTHQESDKTAAEAMIAISLSVEEKLLNDFNSLKWFAEVISTEISDISMDHDGKDSIPDGMDDFEFMTLRLEEHHCPEPFVSKNPSDDETRGAATSRRSRRGQSRRGRQRRDFQRDILPGLVTLSRLEVAEDFQAFEELLKGGDGRWQLGWSSSHRGSARSGRGRKRATTETPCSTEAAQPVCQIEERSLTGWGKKTRRLPRQRCPNAFLSFPVRC